MIIILPTQPETRKLSISSQRKTKAETLVTNSDQCRNVVRDSPVTMTINQAKLQYTLFVSKQGIRK